jgi:tetratricopeptide (TPR) repeat protein
MGLSLSSATPASITRYEEALNLLHSYTGNPLGVIDAALVEDPDFLAGLALRAGLIVTTSEKRNVGELQRTVETAETLIARGLGNDRERAHIAAARAWLDHDFERSTDRYNRLALEHPRDGLALQISHVCNFFLGRATWLRDHVAAALPHLSTSESLYGYAHGMHAFGLEECGEYDRAEAAARRALESNRRDAWAVHAGAHCFEMQGQLAKGIRWLREREQDWAPDNFFAGHNYWHLALFQLELGDIERVLGIYDQKLRGAGSEMNLDLVDASAMLWRLHLAGVDVHKRWTDLATIWRRVEEHGYYGFNDWHALMAYAGSGADADVARVVASLEDERSSVRLGRLEALAACRGFAAFAAGDYPRAIEELFAVRTIAARFGGSHAQRDILDLTLIEAALRDKQFALARSLASARAERKPESPGPFRALARGYVGAGAVESAGSARAEVERLIARQRAPA